MGGITMKTAMMHAKSEIENEIHRRRLIGDSDLILTGISIAWDIVNRCLEKEEQQIIDAVDKTIDAYHYYVESPHNPPPMNGLDYYNKFYKT